MTNTNDRSGTERAASTPAQGGAERAGGIAPATRAGASAAGAAAGQPAALAGFGQSAQVPIIFHGAAIGIIQSLTDTARRQSRRFPHGLFIKLGTITPHQARHRIFGQRLQLQPGAA